MTNKRMMDLEWDDTRAIWAAGKVDIPTRRDDDCIHLLSDLKLAAGMFAEVTRIAVADREREWSPDDGARLCRQLLDILCQIDDTAFSRMVRASNVALDPLVAQTISNLVHLESALKNSPKPPKARKRKHEIDDFLIIRLADIFRRETGRRPSVTTEWDTSERRGDFVDFVMEFTRRMLPEHSLQINGRIIQRALKRGRNWDDPDSLGN